MEIVSTTKGGQYSAPMIETIEVAAEKDLPRPETSLPPTESAPELLRRFLFGRKRIKTGSHEKQVSLLTLTAALLLGACSTYEEVPATSGDGATAVGFLADIAPREQSRADINVDFGTGLTGTWNGEDKLGVLANDFSKLLQFTYTTDSKAFTGSLFGSAGTWAYRAFYPHNGNATVSGTTVTVPFSALRTQNGNKYNSEFDIMAADAITHNNAKPGKTPEGNAVKFNLHRITSILALKLQGGAASEKIASVMLTSKNRSPPKS